MMRLLRDLVFGFFFFNGVSPRYEGPVSDHFDGKKFFSPAGTSPKTLWDVLKWKFKGGAAAWPETIPNTAKPRVASNVPNGQATLTFVNHATMLVQLPGVNILTDPVYSKRTSPFSFAGPARVREPGLAFEDLPKIDLVLVSHNHYDHLDLATLARLVEKHNPWIVVALGDSHVLGGIKNARVREMDWRQTIDIAGAKVSFEPAQHWSARGLFDRNLSLWGAYVFEAGGVSVYFAGDTGYGPHFRETAGRHPRIDVALLPIGAYEPRWFMREQHMNPADAVMAHRDLRARKSVAIHFGTWQLTDESVDQPARDLAAARAEAKVPDADFVILDQGETRDFGSF